MSTRMIPGVAVCLGVALFGCVDPGDAPFEQPENAKIDTTESLQSLGDTLRAAGTVSCTLSVRLPDLVTNYRIVRIAGDTDTVVVDSGGVPGELIVFDLDVPSSGTHRLVATVTRATNPPTVDSLEREVTVVSHAEAGLDTTTGLPCLSDSISIDTSLACTARVILPEFLDTFRVYLVRSGGEGTTLDQGAVDGAAIPFTVELPLPGTYLVIVVVTRTDASGDTLVRTTTGTAPYSPAIVSLVPDTSHLALHREYQCTLRVTHPSLIESYEATLSYGENDVVVSSGPVEDVSVVFALPIFHDGEFDLVTSLHNYDGTRPSLSRTFGTYRLAPAVVADSARYRRGLGDTAEIGFVATDPDSNLLEVFSTRDSSDSVSHPVLASGQHRTEFVRSVVSGSVDTILVSAWAMDEDSQFSSDAVCTLFVEDTVAPQLSVLALRPSTGDSLVAELPCTLWVRVKDDSPIDSVTFGTRHMSVSGDTAMIKLSQLDSGSLEFTVRAYDRWGNDASLSVPMFYEGDKTYPPKISDKLAAQTVAENESFEDVALDSVVVIPPEADYVPAELTWHITEEDPSGKLELTYDAGTRSFSVAVPDSEWAGSEVFFFEAEAPGNLSDSKAATFTVTPVNDPPVILVKNQRRLVGSSFDTLVLSESAYDPDDTVSSLNWHFQRGTYFFADSVWRIECSTPRGGGFGICLPMFTGRVAIAPDTSLIDPETWTGSDTLTIRVDDGHGSGGVVTKKVIFTRYKFELYIPATKFP